MPQRSNQDWIDELSGNQGRVVQQTAHEALGNYLFVVVHNYLLLRQGDLNSLAQFAPEELTTLAEDFVQETLEKLVRHNFALLKQFSARGKFTSWAAQIVRHEAGQELRKSYWMRRDPMPMLDDTTVAADLELIATDEHDDLEKNLILKQEMVIIEACIEKLPARWGQAFRATVLEKRPIKSVAAELNTTANAVYQLICKARQQLRQCFRESGSF